MFVDVEPKTVKLYHNLLAISIWESRWKKPFLKKENKSSEELRDYIKAMSYDILTDADIACLTNDQIAQINKFIEDDKTATTIMKQSGSGGSSEIMTSELLYYYMFSCQIPKECEEWHLGRLIMLISVFGEKNKPPKKMSQSALAARNKSLNDARRAKHGL